MKRILSIFLIFVFCFCSCPILVFAQDEAKQYQYTDDEKEAIYTKYKANEYLFDVLCDYITAFGYRNMVNEIKKDTVLQGSLDNGSKILGVFPGEQDYAEILANLIMMQSGDLAEQIEAQSGFDGLKDGMDYAMDIVDIATSFIGGANFLESISPIIDAATGGTEVIIDNIEQAKYYEMAIQDYSQSKSFLEAVSRYAENEELKNMAKSLLDANDTLLEKRLEYLSNTATTLADYEAEFFVDNLSYELLKTTNIYKTDDTVRWFVDCGSNLAGSISSVISAGQFAFHMTMLAGNIGFGTTDVFSRYQEMRIVADIADAIIKASHKIQLHTQYDSSEVLDEIQTKCDYYQMLVAVHARGEYLLYQLLTNDAGVLSKLQVLFDGFKTSGETTEDWYDEQIDGLMKVSDILNHMFVVEKDSVNSSDLAANPDDDVKFDDKDYSSAQQPETPAATSDERDIVLVLDTSGSMDGTPLEETQKASEKFIDTVLEEDASIGIVTYTDSAEQISDFSVDKESLTKAVEDISAGGGTNIEAGLAEARNMLDGSNAKKKIMVLMSDGKPNAGKTGEELIAYADELKDSGILIYTLGFFESLDSEKSSAQYLMEQLASSGYHYEVTNADDLVFFFEDIADQINGQKYIYIRIACPVDVSVTYDGETLNSSEKNQTLRTDFGTLTFEESEEASSEQEDNRIKVLRLKEGADYDVQIVGTGRGMMDYTIGFMDEDGDYSDFRKFRNVKITKETVVDTVAAVSDESMLNIDEDGDGRYEKKLRAEKNGNGEEIKQTAWTIYVSIGAAVLLLIVLIFVTLKIHKKEKEKVNGKRARFCGNCGMRLEEGAKVCVRCGTPVKVNMTGQEKKRENRKIFKRIAVAIVAAAVLAAALKTGSNFIGYKGLLRKVMRAYEDYDIDKLVSLSSDIYYYGGENLDETYGDDYDGDFAEAYFEDSVGSMLDDFEEAVGHDYKLSYEIDEAYIMSDRARSRVLDSLELSFPDFDMEVIEKTAAAELTVTARQKDATDDQKLAVVMSKENGKWKLLGFEG